MEAEIGIFAEVNGINVYRVSMFFPNAAYTFLSCRRCKSSTKEVNHKKRTLDNMTATPLHLFIQEMIQDKVAESGEDDLSVELNVDNAPSRKEQPIKNKRKKRLTPSKAKSPLDISDHTKKLSRWEPNLADTEQKQGHESIQELPKPLRRFSSCFA